jgi:hypothetical protein
MYSTLPIDSPVVCEILFYQQIQNVGYGSCGYLLGLCGEQIVGVISNQQLCN